MKEYEEVKHISTEVLIHETNKGNYVALSVQSQVKLVRLVYIVDNI